MTDPHISTKDRPGDYDAIETAKPDEPLFPIQGGEPLGPLTVQFWADYARARANALRRGAALLRPSVEFPMTEAAPDFEPTAAHLAESERLLAKARSAEEVGWAMLEYQKGETAAPEVRARYGVDAAAEAVPVRSDDKIAQRRVLIGAVGKLNNAVAEAVGVAETIAAIKGRRRTETRIRRAVELLRQAADELEPRRGQERT